MLAPDLERVANSSLHPSATADQSIAWIATPDGYVVWVSPLQVRPGAQHPPEIEGYHWQNLLDPALLPGVLERWRTLTSSSEPFEFVLPLVDADGHPKILAAHVMPLVYTNGTVTHWVGMSSGLPTRRLEEAPLIKRNAQIEAFLNQSAAGFAETDGHGRFTAVNDRYCEITGRTREELLTLRMEDITYDDDLPHNLRLFREAVTNGQHFSLKKRYVRPDGSLVWVRNSISAIRDSANNVQGVVCISVDISKQIQAEEALRQERGRAKSVLRNMDEAFLLVDHDYRIIDINTYALRLNKQFREEVIGTLIWDQWPGSERMDLGHLYRRVMRDRKPRTEEQLYSWPDGRTAWIEVRAHPVAEGLAIFFRDITERKQAERNNAQLASIVNSSHDAIISCTPQGIIETWNPAAQHLFGWSSSEAVGKSVSLLISEDHATETSQAFRRACQGETVRVETIGKRHDTTQIHVSLAVAPLCDAKGEVIGATAMIRDITELKRAEELQKLLLGELNHRIKNSFALIQALAHQTFRSEGVSRTVCDKFSKRLNSLAASHDLLLQAKREAAFLHQLLATALKGLEGLGARITMVGPEVVLPPDSVIPLTMVMHELATNALKYGSLSVPEGTVDIRWEADGPLLRFCWQERNGPRIEEPTTFGFGSKMIRQALTPLWGAQVSLEYPKDGLICEILLRLTEA